MQPQADSSTLDLFRERLASPFIFTFFWVSCTYNWKLIYWFLYEPLKPSIKLTQLPFDWFYLEPLGLTFLIIALVPWINNLAEFLKRYAGNWFNKILHRFNFKEVVSNDEHISVLDELSLVKLRAHELTDKLERAQEKEINQGQELIRVREEVSTEINKTIEAQDKLNNLEKLLLEAKEISARNKDLYSEAQNSLAVVENEKAHLAKQLEALRTQLVDIKSANTSYRQKHNLLVKEASELHGIFHKAKLDNLGSITPSELIKVKKFINSVDPKILV